MRAEYVFASTLNMSFRMTGSPVRNPFRALRPPFRAPLRRKISARATDQCRMAESIRGFLRKIAILAKMRLL